MAQAAPVGIITGGLKGIGAAVGGRVRPARRPDGPRRTVARRRGRAVLRVREAGGEAVLESADVRDPAAAEGLAARARRRVRADRLPARERRHRRPEPRRRAATPLRWRAVVETNLLGVFYAARAVLPRCSSRTRGTSSSCRPSRAASPMSASPSTSRPSGVRSASRTRCAWSCSRPARTSASRIVEPGLVDTPLTRDNPIVRPLLDETQPLPAEDVARSVVFAFQQPERVLVSEITLRPAAPALPRL